MPDPRQQDHSFGEGGLMFGKYITVYDDKKQVIGVQVGQVPRYPKYWIQQIRQGHVCDEIIYRFF